MFNSIRKKLIFNFVLMAAVIILICNSFAAYQMIAGIENQMKYDGITLANNIKMNIENAGINNTEEKQAIIDKTYKDAGGELFYIGLVSKERVLIAGTSKDAIG